jgi:hypothetical protein
VASASAVHTATAWATIFSVQTVKSNEKQISKFCGEFEISTKNNSKYWTGYKNLVLLNVNYIEKSIMA